MKKWIMIAIILVALVGCNNKGQVDCGHKHHPQAVMKVYDNTGRAMK